MTCRNKVERERKEKQGMEREGEGERGGKEEGKPCQHAHADTYSIH